jgi:hypothetical protein
MTLLWPVLLLSGHYCWLPAPAFTYAPSRLHNVFGVYIYSPIDSSVSVVSVDTFTAIFPAISLSFLHTLVYVIIPERAAVSPARPGAKKRRSERKFPFDKQAFLPRTSSLLFRSFSTNHLGTISLAIRLLYFLAQAITLASYEQRILNQSYRPPAFLVSAEPL